MDLKLTNEYYPTLPQSYENDCNYYKGQNEKD